MEQTFKEGIYIYCVIGEGEAKTFGPLGIGERGDEVYTVSCAGLAAVVSRAPIRKYAVSRDNTMAHEKAIEEVMKGQVVLPVRFCTIAESEEKVKQILENERELFVALLSRVKGKKELGVRAMFKEAVYNEIMEKYEAIRKLKSEIEARPPLKTYFQRMEIGKMVESALRNEKESCKEQILKTLTPLAVEVKNNTTYGEILILNSAFFIEDAKEAEFDQKVNDLDDKFGRLINFKYTGNLPPFNFVNLIIDTGKYSCS